MSLRRTCADMDRLVWQPCKLFDELTNIHRQNQILTPFTLHREAAQAWKQYIEPLKTEFPDIALVSPAITSDVEGKGKAWLAEFFRLCPALECRVDGINIHWYGGAHELDAFIKFVNSCYAQFQRPIWVTEFAIYEDSSAPMAEKQAFIRNAVGFLESNANVAGYAVSFLYTKGRVLGSSSPSLLGAIANEDHGNSSTFGCTQPRS